MLRYFLAATSIFIAQSAIAADYKVLWKSPTGLPEQWIALNLFADQSDLPDMIHLEPSVSNLTERKDPFSEEQVYAGTEISCKIQMMLVNLSNYDIAAKGRFSGTNAPITINFIFPDQSSHRMQGNFAFTDAWSTFKQSPILAANDTDWLQLVSLTPYEFSSNNEAQEFLDSGGCNNFNDVENVEVSSIPLDVMRRGTDEWVPLSSVLEISIFQ